MDDDDEGYNEPTPQPGPPLQLATHDGLTDSQRDWFNRRFESRVPVVRHAPSPGELLSRPATPEQLEVLRHFRLAGDHTALAEFVVQLATEHRELVRDFNRKVEQDSSDEQQNMEELRALLTKKPNGKLGALIERVDEAELSVEKNTEAIESISRSIEDVQKDSRFARRAAQAVLVFLMVSSFGFLWWLWQRAEASGIDKQKLEYLYEMRRELQSPPPRWRQDTKDMP